MDKHTRFILHVGKRDNGPVFGMSAPSQAVCPLPGIECHVGGAEAPTHGAGPADFFRRLLDTADFPRRWDCGRWSAAIGWLHIVSDLAIFAAYLSIPRALAYFLARRRDVPFSRLVDLFGAFILSCGVGHAVESLIFWYPAYRLAGAIKALTAVVSWATVVVTVRSLPEALKLPDLARHNRLLRREMDERIQAEEALQRLKDELEARVRDRTAELEGMNAALVETIAEQRQAEEALRQSEERFRDAFAAAAVGMALVGLDGRWLRVNRSLCEIVGYPADELTAATSRAVTYPDDLEADLGDLRRLLAGETRSYQVEKRYLHKAGHVVWVRLSVSLVRDAGGQPLYFVFQVEDVTSRRRAEAEIADLNGQLTVAYDATIEGWSRALDLRDKDTEGQTRRVTQMTLRLARALGMEEEDLMHVRRGALLHDIGKMGIPDAILLKPGRLTDEEWQVMRRHPQYAYDWLSPIAFLQPALAIPYSHHEKDCHRGFGSATAARSFPGLVRGEVRGRHLTSHRAAHGHTCRETRSPLVTLVHQGSDPTLPHQTSGDPTGRRAFLKASKRHGDIRRCSGHGPARSGGVGLP